MCLITQKHGNSRQKNNTVRELLSNSRIANFRNLNYPTVFHSPAVCEYYVKVNRALKLATSCNARESPGKMLGNFVRFFFCFALFLSADELQFLLSPCRKWPTGCIINAVNLLLNGSLRAGNKETLENCSPGITFGTPKKKGFFT